MRHIGKRSLRCVTLAAGFAVAAAPGAMADPTDVSRPRFGAVVAATQDATDLSGETPSPLNDLLGDETKEIDLGSALRLAGVFNPQILLARQRVVEAVALRQLAAAQWLPSLNLGFSFDNHNGNLQQSTGNILKVDRGSVYLGAGANAIGSASVNIPGLFLTGNVTDLIYSNLIARQVVEERRFASRAAENQMLLRVGVTYAELLRAEAGTAVARRNYTDARDVELLTGTFVKAGAAKQADVDRASTERVERETQLRLVEGQTLIVSARLAELLNLPPTLRLHTAEDKLIPCPVVPDPIPLPELLAIAMLNRPELAERQAVIRQGLLAVDGAKALPFSPTVIIGLSYGGEGGGSNLVAEPATSLPFGKGEPRFGRYAERMDLDVVLFWTLQNLGIGNRAQIQLSRSRLGIAQLQMLETLDRVRTEVANAYARTHARFAQIQTTEDAVRESSEAFAGDLRAVRGGEGRPIELLESLRLLIRARTSYVNAIVDYNQAQLELYVALGQPPADTLARPVPPEGRAPEAPRPPTPR